ncbi:MAG: CoA transferase [Chloroflexi bacterium]|nr:CoA transferase [Chloroflexota bacterium]
MSLMGPHRVLDLTLEDGFLCGKILADMGCDVIKVEPPGGDPGRGRGPFYHDLPDPEMSLYWWAFNTNKRSITLGLETSDGREILRKLVSSADFIIESFAPGYLEGLGLGYQALSALNPRLIMTCITPFGQTGPYAGYKATDLTGMAMGGIMYASGDEDRPPVRISYPQAWSHAALQACVGTMNAHYHRESTGEGQQVDASMQLAVMWTQMNITVTWDMNRVNTKRGGAVKTFSMRRDGQAVDIPVRYTWECKDGYVNFVVLGHKTGARVNRALTEWMNGEGIGLELKGFQWEKLGFFPDDPDTNAMIEKPIAEFFRRHTVLELYRGAIERRIWLAPIGTPSATMENEQLKARDFWREVEHPELGENILYPGWPIKQSESPVGPPRRAPRIGEHNEEIYMGELGLNQVELGMLRAAKVI